MKMGLRLRDLAGLLIATAWAKHARACTIIGGNWSYLAPGTFQGSPWRNDASCLYNFRGTGPSGSFNFSSAPGCRDVWAATPATGAVSGRTVLLTFTLPLPPRDRLQVGTHVDCSFS